MKKKFVFEVRGRPKFEPVDKAMEKVNQYMGITDTKVYFNAPISNMSFEAEDNEETKTKIKDFIKYVKELYSEKFSDIQIIQK